MTQSFKEHDNRKKASKLAEYITGEPLRRLVAEKVRTYCGQDVAIFDGASGSGQLEQFISPRQFTAVEIQAEACEALRANFPRAEVVNTSFFLYEGEECADCTVMNPPFSLKFKELGEAEQEAILREFPWKRSGVVDDIFMLKGLRMSRRYGVFIMFPGIGYRASEQKLRELIGCSLAELNRVQNAFEDTQIDVLLLIVDKEKTDQTCKRELIDVKKGEVIASDTWKIDPMNWATVEPPRPPEEAIDPVALDEEIETSQQSILLAWLRQKSLVFALEGRSAEKFGRYCDELCRIIQEEKRKAMIFLSENIYRILSK